MHSKIDWSDLRFVLAVYRSGSVTKAARTLGVNHATVIRRVATFEEATGLQLFEKTVRGYQFISGLAPVLEAIRGVEASVDGVARAIAQTTSPATGTVRVTSTDTFCYALLPETIAAVQAVEPGLRIDLITANSHLDLARLDADITVRPTHRLSDDLVGDSPGDLAFGIYAAKGYEGEDWLAPSGSLKEIDVARWTVANVPPARIVASSDSFISLLAMAAAGLGKVYLPTCLGDREPRLDKLESEPEFRVPVWVAAHQDMADVPRIRVAQDLIKAALAARPEFLSGGASG